MNKSITRCIILIVLCLYAIMLKGQEILVLEKAGTVRNFKYTSGKDITIKVHRGNMIITGQITSIGDTSIIIDTYTEIGLHGIAGVYRGRRFLKFLSGASFTAGVAYVTIDGVNRIINHDSPVFPASTLIAGGILIGSSFLMKPFFVRKFELGEKWRLRILNPNAPVF